jgi:hypothetical protein
MRIDKPTVDHIPYRMENQSELKPQPVGQIITEQQFYEFCFKYIFTINTTHIGGCLF